MDMLEGRKISHRLQWLHEPESWKFTASGLEVKPRAKTDFFRPYDGEPRDNAPLLHARIKGDFTASTDATAELAGFGDAAALTLRAEETLWAKICIERSPTGLISIVSVVTRLWSDDANGELLPDAACHLRITRKGDTIGMHWSSDGASWRFVRAFGLELPDEVSVGIHAQAPFQDGCRATFRSFELRDTPVLDFRSGE